MEVYNCPNPSQQVTDLALTSHAAIWWSIKGWKPFLLLLAAVVGGEKIFDFFFFFSFLKLGFFYYQFSQYSLNF